MPAIVALVESAYRGETSRAGWTTEAHLINGQRTDVDAVAALVAARRGGVLLAESGRDLVGCCQLEQRADDGAYLGMFSVRPGSQGQGLGRAILAEAEHLAREKWGTRTMSMTVIVQRPDLIAWYERRGYRRTGETRPFPYGNERLGIPRRPDLRFAVLTKPLAAGPGPAETGGGAGD